MPVGLRTTERSEGFLNLALHVTIYAPLAERKNCLKQKQKDLIYKYWKAIFYS